MAVQAFEYEVAAPVRVSAVPFPACEPEVAMGVRRAHLRVVCEDERAARPALRLTRRGRLVRTLVVFGAVSLFALVVAARWAAPDLPPTHSITVQEGQTLSEIAARELPMVPLDAAGVRIRLANGLNSSQVVSGQSLIIPGE